MASLIPYGLMAASAIPNIISGIMGIANAAKMGHGLRMLRRHRARKRGGRMRRHKRYHHRKMRHRGRGAIADALGNIPLLGMIAGPLARALGGHLVHRKGYYKHVHGHRVHVRPTLVHHGRGLLAPAGGRIRHRRRHRARGLAPMYISRPYVGMGLYPYGRRGTALKKKLLLTYR